MYILRGLACSGRAHGCAARAVSRGPVRLARHSAAFPFSMPFNAPDPSQRIHARSPHPLHRHAPSQRVHALALLAPGHHFPRGPSTARPSVVIVSLMEVGEPHGPLRGVRVRVRAVPV